MATKTEPFVSVAPKLGFVGGFDGIRGIGVMMVLVGHALFEYVESWVTIVDTFFVLSAFLIVSLLLQESRTTGDINFKKFYQRRFLRLMPSLWLFLAVWLVIGAIIALIGVEDFKFTELLKDVGAAFGYMYHVFFPNGLSMAKPGMQDNRFMWHLWTLGVEEHFYILMPPIVYLFIKKNWIRTLGALMAAGFVAIGVLRYFAFTGPGMGTEAPLGFQLAFLQRPDSLMLGVLLAIINASLTKEVVERHRKPILAVSTGAIVLWAAMLNLSSGLVEKLGGPYMEYLPVGPEEFVRSEMVDTAYWFRFGHTLGAFAFAFIAFSVVRFPDWWLSRFWSWSPFRYLGRMSYTIYLWHGLPYVILIALTPDMDPFLRMPFLVLAAVAISVPVYNKVELPVMKMKLRFSSEKESLDLTTGKMVTMDKDGKIQAEQEKTDSNEKS